MCVSLFVNPVLKSITLRKACNVQDYWGVIYLGIQDSEGAIS